MRVTTNVIFNSLLNDLNTNREGLAAAQRKLATGKDVSKPSEGPIEYNKARLLEEVNAREAQYQDNIRLAIVQSRTVQNSMDGFISTLNQIKTKTVQAANEGVMSDQELDIIARDVSTAKQTLQTIANTKVLGRFMFAGSKTETQPFTQDENGVVQYNGNDEDLNLQVSDFESVPITVPGTELIALFETVQQLEDALKNRDTDAIRNSIDSIDERFDDVTIIAGDIGASVNKMEYLNEQYERSNIEYKAEISRLTDTDYAEALSNLEKFNIAYQAAIEANQRLISNSLVNLLR